MIGNSKQNSEVRVEISKLKNLDSWERINITKEVKHFVKDAQRMFKHVYLHLDVQELSITSRGVKGYEWGALLETDRGRFYAKDEGFGVSDSLRATLNTLKKQVANRLGKRAKR